MTDEAFTPPARRRLSELETVIEQGLETFVEVGQALLEINQQRFYREIGYERFGDYCRERWGWTRQRAAQLMDAAEVVNVIRDEQLAQGEADDSVTTIVVTPPPKNEAQARELVRLKDPDAMKEVWASVSTEHGPKVTAKTVKRAVDERLAAAPDSPENVARTVKRIMNVVGDEEGKIARETLGLEALDAITELRTHLEKLDPSVYVPVLDDVERRLVRELLRDLQAWVREVEAVLDQPLHLVTRGEDDD